MALVAVFSYSVSFGLMDHLCFAGCFVSLSPRRYTKVISRGRVEQTFEPTGFDCRLDQVRPG